MKPNAGNLKKCKKYIAIALLQEWCWCELDTKFVDYILSLKEYYSYFTVLYVLEFYWLTLVYSVIVQQQLIGMYTVNNRKQSCSSMY